MSKRLIMESVLIAHITFFFLVNIINFKFKILNTFFFNILYFYLSSFILIEQIKLSVYVSISKLCVIEIIMFINTFYTKISVTSL